MKKVSTTWLIHGFALFHALGTISCTLLDVKDSLLLTVLTMTMTVLICYREKLTVEIWAFCLATWRHFLSLTSSLQYGSTRCPRSS